MLHYKKVELLVWNFGQFFRQFESSLLRFCTCSSKVSYEVNNMRMDNICLKHMLEASVLKLDCAKKILTLSIVLNYACREHGLDSYISACFKMKTFVHGTKRA